MTINNGNITMQVEYDGIDATGALAINGGTVTIDSQSIGMELDGYDGNAGTSFTMTGGSVNITGKEDDGISAKGVSLALTGGALTVECLSHDVDYNGMCLTHNLAHNRKCARGSSGAKRHKWQSGTLRKGTKRRGKRRADVRSNFRNAQVVSSSLTTSSKNARFSREIGRFYNFFRIFADPQLFDF